MVAKKKRGQPAPVPIRPVSERLEQVRALRGVETLLDFHDRLTAEGPGRPPFEVSYSAVRNYHYDRDPPLGYLERVAEVFNVSVGWLASGEGAIHRQAPPKPSSRWPDLESEVRRRVEGRLEALDLPFPSDGAMTRRALATSIVGQVGLLRRPWLTVEELTTEGPPSARDRELTEELTERLLDIALAPAYLLPDLGADLTGEDLARWEVLVWTAMREVLSMVASKSHQRRWLQATIADHDTEDPED